MEYAEDKRRQLKADIQWKTQVRERALRSMAIYEDIIRGEIKTPHITRDQAVTDHEDFALTVAWTTRETRQAQQELEYLDGLLAQHQRGAVEAES